ISYNLFQLLKDKLNKNKILLYTDNQSVLKKRIIKNKEEIKNIKKACEIVSEVFETVKKKIVPGMMEIDIHFKIEEEFAKRHVVQSFKTIVASGPNSANPHHISGNRKIQRNDIVLIDMGCIYNGYCSDLTRTFFIGKEEKNKRKIWNIVKQAHDESLIKVKQNIKASDIDFFARNLIRQEGYGKNFIHTTGHGVGLDIHEAPSIGQKSKDILKEGMIITIEPGIYLDKKFGVRIEDTVLVTKNGYKVLTSARY
ncbi:MAG: aminopeptidase P family protein, partial [Elusimicrobia bacterium]|nr:aminopeptidase P family protein [Elusimicrobiota bacterium]